MIEVKNLNSSEVSCYTNSVASSTAIIFLHGVPFNAKLWLKVMEDIKNYNCFSIDLKGFGFNANSHELNPSQYNLHAQYEWLDYTINQIPAERFIFIMHGWSSVAGTMLAQKFADKIIGLGFFEAQVRAVTSYSMLSLPMQEIAKILLDISDLETWVLEENGYPKLIHDYANMSNNDLFSIFSDQYAEPACRAAILQYLYELPLGFKNSRIVETINMNNKFLQRSDMYKAILYTTPGFMTTIETVNWMKHNVSNLSIYDLGHALHCAPMTIPDQCAKAINSWLGKILKI